jgi:site-specific recombinase XerD
MKNVTALADQVATLLRESGVESYDQTKNVFSEVRRIMQLSRPKKRKSRSGPKTIDLRELQSFLLAAYEVSDEIGLMMTALYKTALGVGEFTELSVSDLRSSDNLLVVNPGNPEKMREIIIPADLANLLGYHVGDRSSGPMFMSKRKGAYSARRIQQITQQVSELAGLSHSATPEMIRQTRLEHLREAGMDEEDLQMYVGST